MKLTSMKLTKKDLKDRNGIETAPTAAYEGPEYPYGLTLQLENAALDKLGIDVSDFAVDDTVRIIAEGCITRLSQESRRKGKDDKSISIQIESMAISEGDDLDWDTPKGKAKKIIDERY